MIYFCENVQGKEEIKKERKTQSEKARALLFFGLQREYAIDHMPDISFEKGGKPFLSEYPDICFNYSHCPQGILCGISARPIGVDIETVRAYNEKLAKRACHERELCFLQEEEDRAAAFMKLWVLKEAYVKYTGQGLRMDFRNLDVACAAKNGEGKTGRCYLKVQQYQGCVAAVCSEVHWDGTIIQKEM